MDVYIAMQRNDTDFAMISVYLVLLQVGILLLTIIPTEFLLHKRFTKTGSRK